MACLLLAPLALALSPASGSCAEFNLETATLPDIQSAMERGALTSESLISLSLARIRAYEPAVNAIIALNPNALAEARALDRERLATGPRSAIHGVPVVVKDCIDTADLPTSLGFFGLRRSVPDKDAAVVARLREAGAVILAKVNLSELASGPTMSSAGGQTHNPHDFAFGAAGSSSGSAAAVAAGYAPIGIGTDTTGSIRWPSSTCGVVGLKPTTGLLDCAGVLPTEPSMDTVGPIARSVTDVAILFEILRQPGAPFRRVSDIRPLATGALKGARIGFLRRELSGNDAHVDAVVDAAIERLRGAGATILEIDLPFPPRLLTDLCGELYRAESLPSINGYLAERGPGVPRTLAEILAMSEAVTAPTPECRYPNPGRISGYRDQLSGPPLDDPVYLAARDQGRAFVRASMAGLVRSHGLDAIVYPTSDEQIGKIVAPVRRPPAGHWGNMGESIASLAGWPDLTVPAGFTPEGLPVGLSLTSPEGRDGRLLELGRSFEAVGAGLTWPAGTPALPGEKFAY